MTHYIGQSNRTVITEDGIFTLPEIDPEWESFADETETDPEEWVSQNYDELGSLADLI